MNPLLTPRWLAAVCGAVALIACSAAAADPPGRVARLAQISGAVSFSPAGEEDWVLAEPNRPYIAGDRIWADADARAELQFGTAAARLGRNTSVSILNLDDRIAQLEVSQGTLNLRVRRVYADQFFEVDTPNLAFSIRRAGDYRIDVDPAGNATIIRVRSGEGEAWGEGAAYIVGAGQQYTFYGEGLRDYTFDQLAAPDAFDGWCFDRNRREDAAVAARFVAPDVVGYSDLDDYGSWRSVEGYGNVWFPTSVAAGWVPYRTGHWVWIDPWGWTWTDDQPWGFAPFHYGRWAYVQARWCWVPGPIAVRAVYAPALVAFVGVGGLRLSISTGPVEGVAWFPLGPGEVYRPAYTVSRAYFTNVNVTNTVVNTTVINNVYNNVNVTNIVYRNREAPGAVTAVPTAAFTGAQPVARHAVPLSRDVAMREPVSQVAAVAPSHASVLGATAAAVAGAAAVAVAKRPPRAALERAVVAKTPPAPRPASFAARAPLLTTQPGKPLETEKMNRLRAERPVQEPKVKVVAPSPSVTPQPITREGGAKGARGERAGAAAPGGPSSTVPQPPAQQERIQERRGAQPQGAPVPQPSPQEERMKERRGAQPQGTPVPQPPAQQERIQERRGAQPQVAPVPQPSPQEERMKERRGAQPQGTPVPQPPAQQERIQERRGAQPQGAPVPQPSPQEERMKERRGGQPQGTPVPQPSPQEKERRGGPPQGTPVPQPPAQQERIQERRGGQPQVVPAPQSQPQERRAAPPQPAPPQPAPQERAQKGPPPQPPQANQPPPKREEGKGKEREKDKEKEKEKEKERGKEGQ